MILSIIVAIGPHNVIGMDNDLPWHYSEDLKYFKKVTLNHPVFMGYNTYLSIYNRLGHALPKRNNYVLTYEKELDGASAIHSLEELYELAKDDDEVFVIGGKMIYAMMLPVVDKLYITHVKKEYPGNVYFPEIDYSQFNLISETEALNGELVFAVYERKKSAIK